MSAASRDCCLARVCRDTSRCAGIDGDCFRRQQTAVMMKARGWFLHVYHATVRWLTFVPPSWLGFASPLIHFI